MPQKINLKRAASEISDIIDEGLRSLPIKVHDKVYTVCIKDEGIYFDYELWQEGGRIMFYGTMSKEGVFLENIAVYPETLQGKGIGSGICKLLQGISHKQFGCSKIQGKIWTEAGYNLATALGYSPKEYKKPRNFV